MKELKAYSVQGDEYGCIRFATSNAAARREGANELDCEFEDIESCRRAPQFDQHAEAGKVPPQALLDAGWWMGCSHCERHVYDDEPEYVIHADAVYCREACRDAERAYRVMNRRRDQAVID